MPVRPQLIWIAASALFAAAPAVAQTPTPAPKPAPSAIPEEIAPGAKPTEPTRNLSQRLSQSGGVIKPKEVDPAIDKGAPKTGDQNTIRPPGSPGATPRAQPK